MLVPIDEQSNRRDLILPVDVNLRECSVVIIGSTCQICGRDFKCITDVALHMQWRHQQLERMLNIENRHDHIENTVVEMQKCDVCDEHLMDEHLMDEHDTADLKSYKRQINKKQIHEKRRARKLRLIIKIAGVTMTEIRLSRKYLKVHSNEYFADVGTQTESHENEKRQDDHSTSIDLSLADRVVGNSRVQCVRPHKTTNRYIEGKLASIQGDAIACSTRAPARRPIEISSTPNGDATIGANGPCASPVLVGHPRKIAFSQAYYKANSFIRSFVDTIDVPGEANSPRRNAPERRNLSPAMQEGAATLQDQDWYRRNRSPRHRPGEETAVYQRVRSAGTPAPTVYDALDETSSSRRSDGRRRNTSLSTEEDTSILGDRSRYRWNHSPRYRSREEPAVYQRVKSSATAMTATTSTVTPNSWCNKNPRHPVWSDKTAKDKVMNKSTEPIEIVIDNESDENCDVDVTKRSTASSTRVDRERQSTTAEPIVDDDVQEILRITRGKVQSDINHESPNRTEREMLVRNALGQMYVSSTQPEIIYPEKDDTIVVVNNNNVDPRDCPPCVAIVNDDCPFPNVATFMCKTYNDKLGICLNKLRNYSIRYCNNLPEINNNG